LKDGFSDQTNGFSTLLCCLPSFPPQPHLTLCGLSSSSPAPILLPHPAPSHHHHPPPTTNLHHTTPYQLGIPSLLGWRHALGRGVRTTPVSAAPTARVFVCIVAPKCCTTKLKNIFFYFCFFYYYYFLFVSLLKKNSPIITSLLVRIKLSTINKNVFPTVLKLSNFLNFFNGFPKLIF